MATVDRPMVESAMTSVVLRPIRSPKMSEECRANRSRQKCDTKGGERFQSGRGGVGSGKEQPGKNQHRGGSVNVEIEELDRGADQAGKKDLARRIDWPNGLRRAHRISDISFYLALFTVE